MHSDLCKWHSILRTSKLAAFKHWDASILTQRLGFSKRDLQPQMLRYVSAQKKPLTYWRSLLSTCPVPESYELITSGGSAFATSGSMVGKEKNGEGPGESSKQSESDQDPPLHETINESCFRRLRTQMGVFTSQTFHQVRDVWTPKPQTPRCRGRGPGNLRVGCRAQLWEVTNKS